MTWQPDARATLLLNRAETRMARGDLQRAIDDYRQSLALASDPELRALGYYGLGISLERDGDLPSALGAMRAASAARPPTLPRSVLDGPGVFFLPRYDRHYYEALEAMASAEQASDPEVKLLELQRAIGHWSRYLTYAEPAAHRWVRNARLHRLACTREFDELARREREGRRRPRR
jgi:tetratricopeptide (TPR) repeat protein